MSFSKTPRTPSTPNPARLQELTATDPYEDGVEDLLKLSIVPDAAHDAFRETVDSVDAFLSCDQAPLLSLLMSWRLPTHHWRSHHSSEEYYKITCLLWWNSSALAAVYGPAQRHWSNVRLLTPRSLHRPQHSNNPYCRLHCHQLFLPLPMIT